MAITTADAAFLEAALELAARGPVVDPNPRVGCVLVNDGAVVGRGFHRGAGTPHAEAAALADAGEKTRGATAFVTLEPCNHHGRTPPCAAALIDAGVVRVVYAAADPSHAAAGGAQRLRAAGIAVEQATDDITDHAARAEALNPGWTFAARHGRPLVTWKSASTLDGRVAAADGTSRWITGPASRQEVHRLRARVGAVVVGTGTVRADDPALTVRDVPHDGQPLRVVLGRSDIPSSAKIFDDAAETLVIPTHDPAKALEQLHERGIRHVLLEGGPTLAAAFLAAGLVDEIHAYLAPVLLGAGAHLLGDLGIGTIADGQRWHLDDVARFGDDVRLIMSRTSPNRPARED
ncbi:bifunctional diaminohydroxyphosphoribosylaminopyrimidine deaminase/5-amino-6-(5-phosphoribosylamino)uracil reductase RibD [Calidifontibacter indicus]|uniref:Riboflavin biosynthesis protein RibD n=1 Tax=Calidifontibacter indicus TaxID=419650 RepID=A0A3D9UNS3_9MICO|nr:bifunctional diaminohydroxyphosphoribosylaminopyrimidine deaminase/5-amino-6-(5-phosphoribosylamino)uracil reductase RibD [Calidifontibacter indicus]REF30989.1 diaminohydroxyphosphoribosylaminopyrimidine deaminase/5-amino-6-(5-phosphoribosylamino)uracil reductase [Calidifontibacter indicus]